MAEEIKFKNVLEKFNFHLDMNSIKKDDLLNLFEDFLVQNKLNSLECSIKYAHDNVFSKRFNIWFKGKNHFQSISNTIKFFNQVENKFNLKLNYDLLKNFFGKEFDLDLFDQVIMGVDFREDLSKSRLKLWVLTLNYGVMKKLIQFYGINYNLASLPISNQVLLGFDFGFDGSLNNKIYFTYFQELLNQDHTKQVFKNLFSKEFIEVVNYCDLIHISLSGGNGKYIFHFAPCQINFFKEKFSSSVGYDWNFPLKVFSTSSTEFNSMQIRNYNIYY
ncbi:hypothetical protein HN587_06445 [Candidatus Woesearchaeota archaeon]|jgi:LynF/TruF/PatF family peptide O-prenyltransferase|nr:hypothetical protein [Candidatus Woesearchaeota archaeon]